MSNELEKLLNAGDNLERILTNKISSYEVRNASREWNLAKKEMSNEPKWQPIETAPKDGTPILCFIENATLVVLFWGLYDSFQKCGDLYGWLNPEIGGFCPYADVTHWMPLPKPPTQ